MISVQAPLTAADAVSLEFMLSGNVVGRVAWLMAWLVVAVAQPCGETVVVAGETAQQELEAQSFADACEQLFSVWSGELLGGGRKATRSSLGRRFDKFKEWQGSDLNKWPQQRESRNEWEFLHALKEEWKNK